MSTDMVDTDITKTTIYHYPKVFTDKGGEPILIRHLDKNRHNQLITMYLNYQPRNSFDGLPPISDEACVNWVNSMIETGISLVAISFEQGLTGHAVIFPMNDRTCEMLIVVSPRHQQLGIGTQLIKSIIQLSFEIGYHRIWLTVSTTNFIAKHLYRKFGFEFKNSSDIDQVEMILDLQQFYQAETITVGSLMCREVISIHQDKPCKKALEIFIRNNISSMPVVNTAGEVVGILSQFDLIMGPNVLRTVKDVSTRSAITVTEGSSLAGVIRLFQSKMIRSIPVIDDRNKLVGILGRRDVLAYYARQYSTF